MRNKNLEPQDSVSKIYVYKRVSNTMNPTNQSKTSTARLWKSRQPNGNFSRIRYNYIASRMVLLMVVLNSLHNVQSTSAFVYPISSPAKRVSFHNPLHARRKTITPERVEPLQNKNPQIKRDDVSRSPFTVDSSPSISKVSVSPDLSDPLEAIYAASGRSNMSPRQMRGRPASVPGAMNKSTMMNNAEAAAAADEIIASGMVSSTSKNSLIAIAQERKKVADRNKYYDELPEGESAISKPRTFYEKIGEKERIITTSSAPPLRASKVINTSQPKKRGRGRPRKKSLPPDDIISSQSVSALEPQSAAQSLKNKKGKRTKTRQVRKPDKNTKHGKLKGDKLNLQQYYKTELLTTPEEYSLGVKVQFLMECEDVYHGLTNQMLRNPSLSEWAYACGFTEYDDVSKEGYVESRLESSLRPPPMENSPVKTREEEEERKKITGAKFVGNGLENETGVGRGRGRAKKPLPLKLTTFYDDSLIKHPTLQSIDAEPPIYKSFMEDESGKIELIPINRGSPRHFIEMILTAKEAKQRMIECNMRLVVSIARRYHNVGVNIQDLVQEGSLGLSRAAEKFDPSKGYKFSTYASWWIQQAVFRSIAYHSRTIRLPVHVHNLLNRTRRVKTSLTQELGRPPTNEELAKELDMPAEKFSKMIHLTKRTISLEKPKYTNNPKDLGHESEATLGDTIDSSSTIKDDNSPEEAVDQGLFQDDLKDMLQILGEDERRVICARYGLHDGLTRTVSAVAVQLRQSKSWVRSQECRALRKLRRPWYEKRLKEHQNSLTGAR